MRDAMDLARRGEKASVAMLFTSVDRYNTAINNCRSVEMEDDRRLMIGWANTAEIGYLNEEQGRRGAGMQLVPMIVDPQNAVDEDGWPLDDPSNPQIYIEMRMNGIGIASVPAEA